MFTSQLFIFLTATLVLLVIPGPSVLFIVSRSIEQGTRAGISSVGGIALGGLVHLLFAVMGLSAILAASAVAFSAVKYAGAAYLIYLGITKLLERPKGIELTRTVKRQNLTRLFWQGFVVEVFNPKVALFFLSFLPQFVNPNAGNVSLQICLHGCAFIVMAFVTDSTYAILAGTLGEKISQHPRVPVFQKWFTGVTYLSLGTLTAVSGGSHKK